MNVICSYISIYTRSKKKSEFFLRINGWINVEWEIEENATAITRTLYAKYIVDEEAWTINFSHQRSTCSYDNKFNLMLGSILSE